MLISNKLHSFRNFESQIYNFSCINGANVCVFICHAHVCTSFFLLGLRSIHYYLFTFDHINA